MPARVLKPRHQDDIRAKIQASQLINRLTDHIFGKVELSATQVAAARILLNKAVPDLSQVQMNGEVEHKHYVAELPAPNSVIDVWAQPSGSLSGDPSPAHKLNS